MLRLMIDIQIKKHLLLNRNNFCDYSQNTKNVTTVEEPKYIHFSEIDIFPNNHWFSCQRKIDHYNYDMFKFIKNNKYIINKCSVPEKCI